ncbi:MAG: glycosyltransferase [Gemmatimonadota bacterium]|nr:glycosyltransferase [Gemmatimonadota bacterium]
MSAHRRILFVDHAGVLGGAEFSLLDIISAFGRQASVVLLADGPFRTELERRGVSVVVDALGAAARVRKAGIVPSPAALWDVFGAARRLAGRARDADLLYANSQKAFVVAALAGWLARRPVVWHLRDILGPPHFSATNARGVTWLANRCARSVIANSQATADAFVRSGGNALLIRVVHNGIDSGPFDAVTADAVRAARSGHGAHEGMPLVVHVGRFHPWKGQQVLLRALALEPRAQAWIIGAPLFGEEAFADELRALARELNLGHRVRFLGMRNDVPLLLAAADLVVHSSIYPEPFGRVVVEGMLAGKPVIAANAGGVSEIARDGETALLVPPADSAALARAISSVIDDPARARAMAQRGQDHARSRFTRDAMLSGVRAAIAAAGLPRAAGN